MAEVVVVGQIGRDLVLGIDRLPAPGGSASVGARRELLGGKGANQAVACAQLGGSVGLIGVVGADEPGAAVLAQARDDGIDVTGVVTRADAATALLVDVVERDGTRRLLEDVPPAALLTPDDVAGAAETLRAAGTVLIQLQQPGAAVAEALRQLHGADVTVVVDGGVDDEALRDEILAAATVLRADEVEASQLAGRPLDGVPDTLEAARQLLAAGPRVVALAAGGDGNVVVWDGGHVVVPLLGDRPVDPTGAGDAFVAGMAMALHAGLAPGTAGWWASAAAALTVGHLGGRPDLTRGAVERLVEEARPGA